MPVHSRASDYYPTSAIFAFATWELNALMRRVHTLTLCKQRGYCARSTLVPGLQVQDKSLLDFPRQKGLPMTFSILLHWKQPTTRCSICGWSVTLELSKTDEGGRAVHESCYVPRTISKFRKPIDELPQSCAIAPIDPVRTASEPALAGSIRESLV